MKRERLDMEGFKKELTAHILPFWINFMVDDENGGFYGRMDGHNRLIKGASKGAVLNARLLWTFSAAYRLLKTPVYLEMAKRAYNYICKYFIDPMYGGVYWELDCKGNPINRKKQTYAQGFTLYGFTEYYRATKDITALEKAIQLFELIEEHKDKQYGGYFEAFTDDWKPIDDMRLSDKDANEKKSMNTHLHILEPYTNLLRVWPNEHLKVVQQELITIFLNHILNPETRHLELFFDERWNKKSSIISFGHDIEASWLLYEAAQVLGDSRMMKVVMPVSIEIAMVALEGLESDGSMIYESEFGRKDMDRHWWVQAESVVGFMYAYKNSGNILFKEKACDVWNYVQQRLIDIETGEWYWSIYTDNTVNRMDDKAGFWKCPYHNSRMCMEMIEHFFIC